MPALAALPASLPSTFSTDDLAAALDQLNGSERGHAAAVAFRRFLEANDGSVSGLDSENWQALATLVKACRVFGAWKIRNVLPKR
jgi:hypothetical protein